MILSWMKTIATFIWYFEIIEMSIDLVAKASLDDEKYGKFKKSIDDADKAITKKLTFDGGTEPAPVAAEQ